MRPDPWLAERFGRDAWWVPPDARAAEVRAHAAAHAPAFYQAKVDGEDVSSLLELQSAGMLVVDLNLTLARQPEVAAEPPVGVREAAEGDRAAVEQIAARELTRSRFHRDPQIPPELASRVKRDWIGAHFDGTRGDGVLVAEREGKVAGFLAMLSGDRSRVIDLIAVSEAQRARGIGASLVRGLLAATSDAELVEVGTQAANAGATRFYERLGFRLRRARYVLHLHVSGD